MILWCRVTSLNPELHNWITDNPSKNIFGVNLFIKITYDKTNDFCRIIFNSERKFYKHVSTMRSLWEDKKALRDAWCHDHSQVTENGIWFKSEDFLVYSFQCIFFSTNCISKSKFKFVLDEFCFFLSRDPQLTCKFKSRNLLSVSCLRKMWKLGPKIMTSVDGISWWTDQENGRGIVCVIFGSYFAAKSRV